MSEHTVIARWESDGGKYYAELYADQWGYGFNGTNSSGTIGKVTETEALAWMEERTASWTQSRHGGYFHPGKRPMRRTDTDEKS